MEPSFPATPQPPALPPEPTGSYLDEIAAPARTQTLKPWQLWALIGGVLLLILIVGSMILSGGGKSQSQKLTDFVYRVEALQSLAKDNAKNIQSSDLRADNAALEAILTGIDQQSATPLANNGVKKLQPAPKTSPITAEYAKLSETLDNARLNVVFDRTYAREITYQLNTLRAEMKEMYSSKSKSLKSFLETSDASIQPLAKQFADFNG